MNGPVQLQRSLALAVILSVGPTLGFAQVHEHAAEHVHEPGVPAAIDVLTDVEVEFDLVGSGGSRVTEEAITGRYALLTFGFTHCPNVCPMMAAAMGAAVARSERDAVGVFISVDTERDTPEITQAYAENFGDDMLGLSGSYEQVVTAARNFNVSFAVTKTQDSYNVQHSANIYLIDPEGELMDVFPLTARPEELAAAIDD